MGAAPTRSRMRHHRTTARARFLLLLATAGLALSCSSALALNQPADLPPVGKGIVFPLVGTATYVDDFGQPRGQGPHEGNDIVTTWRSPAVAAEDGTIKFWTTSAR